MLNDCWILRVGISDFAGVVTLDAMAIVAAAAAVVAAEVSSAECDSSAPLHNQLPTNVVGAVDPAVNTVFAAHCCPFVAVSFPSLQHCEHVPILAVCHSNRADQRPSVAKCPAK